MVARRQLFLKANKEKKITANIQYYIEQKYSFKMTLQVTKMERIMKRTCRQKK